MNSGLLATEKVLIAMLLSAAALYAVFGVSPAFTWEVYYPQLAVSVGGYIFGFFVAFLCLMTIRGSAYKRQGKVLLEGELWLEFKTLYLKRSSILRDLRLINAVMLMFAIFAYQKHLIPYVNSNLYDAGLLQFERKVFLSRTLTEILIGFFSVDARFIISAFYTGFYVYVPLVLFIMILQRKDLNLADQFCAAFLLCWFLGILMVYALPTWGPCFFAPGTIMSLPPDTEVARLQTTLWRWREYLIAHPGSTEKLFAISGLPSLHIAVAALGSIYLARINKLLALLSWVFVLLTFISTVYFGWHYVSDNLAALLLAILTIPLARYLARPKAHLLSTPLDTASKSVSASRL